MSILKRPYVLNRYVEQMRDYLQYMYPEQSEDKINTFLKDILNTKIFNPSIKSISYPSYGNMYLDETNLLSLINDTKDKILTPFGTSYYSTDEILATDVKFTQILTTNRSKAKKLMLKALEIGDKNEADIQNAIQQTSKIYNNSVSGAHYFSSNAFYDKEAYNAITSTGRYAVTGSYGFTEQFLTSNYYFPNSKLLINYILHITKICPNEETINHVVNKFNLKVLSDEEILDRVLLLGMKMYGVSLDIAKTKALKILKNIPIYKKIYLTYFRNLHSLFTLNTEVFKTWLNSILSIKPSDIGIDENIDPFSMFKLDEDLYITLQILYDEMLEGKIVSDLPKDDKNTALLFYMLGLEVQKKIDSFKEIIDVFLHGNYFPQQAFMYKNMLRKSVIASDTDSVIFTAKELCSWYIDDETILDNKDHLSIKINNIGNLLINRPLLLNDKSVYKVNSILVYLLTKSMESMLNYVSMCFGAIGNNIKTLQMKNEYFMPVFIRTDLKKNYLSIITYKEGKRLPKPKLDIKGVLFKSSNVAKPTLDFNKKLMEDLMNDSLQNPTISSTKYIIEALEYEKSIYDSIMSGDISYFGNAPIKKENEYKIPDSSIYYNYKVWQEVFAKKYVDIKVPSKCTLLPINFNKLKSNEYLEWLKTYDYQIYTKLIKALEKLGKKKLSRLPIPMELNKVPEELRSVINTRSVIYKNMALVQQVLVALNISLGINKKREPLFLDYYSDYL